MIPRKEDLESLFNDLPNQMAKLRLSSNEILNVLEPLETQPGGESRVFKVRTKDGIKVARINYAQPSKHRNVPILLHTYFARLGIAPGFLGTIDDEELTAFIKTYGKKVDLRSPWQDLRDCPPLSILLIDFVEGAWNLAQPERANGKPPHFELWDKDFILKQIYEIEQTMTSLDIQIVDPQFLVSKNSEVKIIDIDHSFFIDSAGSYWGYAGKYDSPLKCWHPKAEIKNEFFLKAKTILESYR